MDDILAPRFIDPVAARKHLEALRWPLGAECPSNLADSQPVEAVGVISLVTAKGQLAFHSDEVRIEDLKRVRNWCHELSGFVNVIRTTYFHAVEQSPLLDKPPLPEKLKKPRHSLQELRSPPAS